MSNPPVSVAPTPWPRWIVTGLAVAGLAALLWLHGAIVAPFVLSLALAYVLEPLVARMTARGVPALLAVSLCLIGAVLLVLMLGLLLVPIVVELAPMLRQQLPDLTVRAWHALVPWLAQFGLKVPGELADLKPVLVKVMSTHGEEWLRAVLTSARSGGGALLSASGLAVLVPILAFYWLMDWTRLTSAARDLVPMRWRGPVHGFFEEADEVMGHYLRGQILVMLILAAYYSVGLMLFGFDLALPIGVFTGLAVFIPYLGFGLGLVLALLAGLLQFAGDPGGGWHALIAVGVVYGLGQMVESFLLTPRLVGERIGLHPLGVIFVLMLFGQWLGFVGVLMALPVSALFMVWLRRCLRAWRVSRFYQDAA